MQGPHEEKKKREKERSELRDLVGKNLHVLGQLDGVDLEMYKEVVLPRVLEQGFVESTSRQTCGHAVHSRPRIQPLIRPVPCFYPK